ncbi:OmpH family outer membrane protein [Candidatus Obscuribacterales bacterium]|nr:OmpH family outer membrane protein [Candidatus Obscuribacterales bacterium]
MQLKRTSTLFSIALALVATAIFDAPASAQKAASPSTVKIGYFNLTMVKAKTPAGDADALKNQAEGQLRRDIETGQKAIEKARADKKTEAEIKDIVKQVQTELAAKQQALFQLVQSATLQDTQRLVQAVNVVAKKKGLDLIVDANAVYAGGKEVLDKGIDVTNDVIEAVNPMAAIDRAAESKKEASE